MEIEVPLKDVNGKGAQQYLALGKSSCTTEMCPETPCSISTRLSCSSSSGKKVNGQQGRRPDMTRLWTDGDKSQLPGYETLEGAWSRRTTAKQCLKPNRNFCCSDCGNWKSDNKPSWPIKDDWNFSSGKKSYTGAIQMIFLFLREAHIQC